MQLEFLLARPFLNTAKLEKEKEKKEAEFLNPDLSGDEINQASVELQQIQDKIDEFTERWFDLSAKMEG